MTLREGLEALISELDADGKPVTHISVRELQELLEATC